MNKVHSIVLLIALCWISFAQKSEPTDSYSPDYENHNQIDSGPLGLSVVQGESIIQIGHENRDSGVPGAWYGLFNEQDHKLVSRVMADSDGSFKFQDIQPGRYRLVAKAHGFCSANVPLKIVKHPSSHKNYLLIHFTPGANDECSYGELIRKPAL